MSVDHLPRAPFTIGVDVKHDGRNACALALRVEFGRLLGSVLSRYLYHATFCIMILVRLHTKSSSMFHAVCLQIVPAKMENPDNEDIIIQIEETLHLFL
jgi:hypothetical protein